MPKYQVDVDAMRAAVNRQKADAKSRGGSRDNWSFPKNETTCIYIPHPLAEMNGFIYVPILKHRKFNDGGRPDNLGYCLSEDNEALWCEATQAALADINEGRAKSPKGKKAVILDVDEGCPSCEVMVGDPSAAYLSENMSDKAIARLNPSKYGMMVPVPMGRIVDGNYEAYQPGDQIPHVVECSPTLWEQIVEAYLQACRKVDPSDMDNPVLINVTVDPDSPNAYYTATMNQDSYDDARDGSGTPLPKWTRAALAAQYKIGGDADPFRKIAAFATNAAKMRELMGAGKAPTSEEEVGAGRLPCFGSSEHDPEDASCKQCKDFDACAAVVGESAPPKAKKAEPKPKPAAKKDPPPKPAEEKTEAPEPPKEQSKLPNFIVHAPAGDAVGDKKIARARRALENAGLDPEDIDGWRAEADAFNEVCAAKKVACWADVHVTDGKVPQITYQPGKPKVEAPPEPEKAEAASEPPVPPVKFVGTPDQIDDKKFARALRILETCDADPTDTDAWAEEIEAFNEAAEPFAVKAVHEMLNGRVVRVVYAEASKAEVEKEGPTDDGAEPEENLPPVESLAAKAKKKLDAIETAPEPEPGEKAPDAKASSEAVTNWVQKLRSKKA